MTSENGNASERERAARIIDSVRPEQVLAGIGDLIKQVDWSIPKGVYDGEPMWTVVGHALITRMRDTMDSIALLVPSHRESDALVLLRVVYEHVVTFCWLAIDPKTNLEEWWDDAKYWRRKQVEDAAENFGLDDLMTDEEMSEAEAADRMINLVERSKAVEEHWSQRIPGFRGPDELLSLRGLYTVLFREASGTAHATSQSVAPVIEGGDWKKRRHRVAPERTDRLFWHALSVPVFCHALLVCHEEFGWPDPDVVRAINDGLLHKESEVELPDRPERFR
jgi:hypothetical protein